MLLANVRTSVGLVNGAVGRVVAAVLVEEVCVARHELRNAVSAADVKYIVVDVPSYVGPLFLLSIIHI